MSRGHAKLNFHVIKNFGKQNTRQNMLSFKLSRTISFLVKLSSKNYELFHKSEFIPHAYYLSIYNLVTPRLGPRSHTSVWGGLYCRVQT
ncbi:hypothetical protein QL285_047610 [Trifolium repens]|nr:hypothetical protein QL285_047610 [Trifolium repens]